MDSGTTPLRWLVEKWLQPTAATPARVSRVKSPRTRATRCVRVEINRSSDVFSVFFFRHNDGSWYVFPPHADCPAMNEYRFGN
ncbi:MAG: hypothetical protein PW947_05990 [Paraburkholderia sp.]|nr:hypothetical protein [Paraburkholderia sp.]MDE1180038.1 hypothetical protein [Paraburkholderia sp.]